MRFGMFDTIRWHDSMTGEDTLANALEQAEFADKMGIDDIWLGEHHFSRHGILSGIFSFMGAVAARTKRARIGTSIVVRATRRWSSTEWGWTSTGRAKCSASTWTWSGSLGKRAA